MEDFNKVKDGFKLVIKNQIKDSTKSSLDKHWDEMNIIIANATEYAKKTISENEIFIENVAKEARAGASYVAVNQMFEKVADDAFKAAEPFVKKLSNGLIDIVMQATKEAITESMQEELAKKIKQGKNEPSN